MKQTLTRRELRAVEQGHGYICKTCAGPAPVGIGYIANGRAAKAASQGISSCPCGASQLPAEAAV